MHCFFKLLKCPSIKSDPRPPIAFRVSYRSGPAWEGAKACTHELAVPKQPGGLPEG